MNKIDLLTKRFFPVVFTSIIIVCIGLYLVVQKELFTTKKTYYVDNAQIRALYQEKIKRDILSSAIKSEQDLKDRIKNFDDELEKTINSLAKEYEIDIYATRAFYSSGEKIDLSVKVLENLEKKGFITK